MQNSTSGTWVPDENQFYDISGVKLSTPVSFVFTGRKIDHQSKLLLAGSCFAENIGHWLQNLGFDAEVNPAGIAYNPISIAKHIEMALSPGSAEVDDLVETDFGFAHLDFHSDLSAISKPALISKLGRAMAQYAKNLLGADTIIFTFGTAIIFESVKTGRVVNNCHKLPDIHFSKRQLNEDEMALAFNVALEMIFSKNPNAEVCFTVSPVRHLRHGAIENQRSKARLIRLCEMLCESDKRCHYIPIYEYVMDELRDYRYYRHDDLIHLNEGGLEMVQQQFEQHYLEPTNARMLERIKRWQHLKSHRVMHPGSDSAKAFEEKLRKETAELGLLFPKLIGRTR